VAGDEAGSAEVPARWVGAQDDADLRADLLEALAEANDG
jgi:hypothetical protein